MLGFLKKLVCMRGTLPCTCIHSNRSMTLSRRDYLDLVLLCLDQVTKRNLPCSHLDSFQRPIQQQEKYTSIDTLCEGFLVKNISRLGNYVNRMKFDEKPEYTNILQLSKKIFIQRKYKDDNEYIWRPKYIAATAQHSLVLKRKE
jgi:hypothetical protein